MVWGGGGPHTRKVFLPRAGPLAFAFWLHTASAVPCHFEAFLVVMR